ncbi:hypothetical protein [Streptomyces sp. 8L]|uniref:hypothetical protein n=1 Tax=Streptomyces sp. 8L TaxID=2877242 RepID=UPI001CD5F147|nr:hypothetical protein [Streptomyces sp. 8L]MCA1219958.1 hypothetical protein [Streptomyces sp. 8L]
MTKQPAASATDAALPGPADASARTGGHTPGGAIAPPPARTSAEAPAQRPTPGDEITGAGTPPPAAPPAAPAGAPSRRGRELAR